MSTNSAFRITVTCVLGASLLTGCAGMSKEHMGQAAGMTTGAVVGGVIGNQIGGRGGMIVGAILGSAIGGMVGYEIGKSLSEGDRKIVHQKMALGLSQAKSGETHTWTNANKTASASYTAKDGRAEVRPARLKRTSNVQAVNELELIGKTYRASKVATLSSGPASSTMPLGKLAVGEEVMVWGRVPGQPWYLVARNDVALGFVPVSAMKGSGAPDTGTILSAPPAVDPNSAANGTVIASDVNMRTTCRPMSYEIATNGTKAEDGTFEGCRQVDGNWLIQPKQTG